MLVSADKKFITLNGDYFATRYRQDPHRYTSRHMPTIPEVHGTAPNPAGITAEYLQRGERITIPAALLRRHAPKILAELLETANKPALPEKDTRTTGTGSQPLTAEKSWQATVDKKNIPLQDTPWQETVTRSDETTKTTPHRK
ncbi:MAG: hypothetical protein K2Q01_04745 [Rickettsiales bacterium]|nr:hypothetical protein [Rickettsiales bacterium]